jgi:1-acyl-sn-glycerol-3-phosphate acyltransferase
VLGAAGIRVAYHGLEHARGIAPRVFICNHLSMVDVWAVAPALPASNLYVAKRSLFRIPVVGWAMRAAGFIAIDRQQRADAIRSLEAAAALVRAGRSILLYPEGTRSRTGRLAPFKKGPFHLALAARVPVVPVAVSGSWRTLPPGAVLIRQGPVRVSFSPPIDLATWPAGDVEGLMVAVRRAIVAGLAPDEIPESEIAPLAKAT